VKAPTNGLGLLVGTSSILLAGKTISADVREAISDCALRRTIEGASTLTLTVQDTSRKLLRSPIFASRATLGLDGLAFELVKIAKTGDRLALTGEAQAVASLRRQKGARSAAAGTTTRSEFAARLVGETPGVKFLGYTEPAKSRVALSRAAAEDTWTCLTRLASEVGWRCFDVNGTVMFGPDSWLLAQPLAGKIVENTGGIDMIDFDHDAGKPTQTLSVTCTTDAWSYPPGAPVSVTGMGLVSGLKLVQQIERSLFYTQAKITLTSGQPVIPPAAPAKK
jgi:hypothetical protein